MRRFVFALAMSAMLLAALAGPAAAVWDDTDIVHWRIWKPGKHALIMAKATDTGMELSAAIEGLTAVLLIKSSAPTMAEGAPRL